MGALAAAAAVTLWIVLACDQPKQAAPAAPPPTIQCGRDSDCKGDRICDHGSCVSPR